MSINIVIEDLKIVEKIVFNIKIVPLPWKVGTVYANKNSRVTKFGNAQKANMAPSKQNDQFKKTFASQALKYAPSSRSERLKSAILLCFDFHLPRPKGNTDINALPLADSDLTNLQKLAEDALTKKFWNDDNQVINIVSNKSYIKPEGEKPSITTYVYYVEKE